MALSSNYQNVPMTREARQSIDSLIVALTTKYRRRFTISEAIKQAADDLCLEALGETMVSSHE